MKLIYTALLPLRSSIILPQLLFPSIRSFPPFSMAPLSFAFN